MPPSRPRGPRATKRGVQPRPADRVSERWCRHRRPWLSSASLGGVDGPARPSPASHAAAADRPPARTRTPSRSRTSAPRPYPARSSRRARPTGSPGHRDASGFSHAFPGTWTSSDWGAGRRERRAQGRRRCGNRGSTSRSLDDAADRSASRRRPESRGTSCRALERPRGRCCGFQGGAPARRRLLQRPFPPSR